MPTPPLDAVEASRVLLTEAEDLARAARRLVPAADALERAAASFAHGLVVGRPPDGQDLLARYGGVSEALAAARAALVGVEDGLASLRFVFTDAPEPPERLRQRAVDELRQHLARRKAEGPTG